MRKRTIAVIGIFVIIAAVILWRGTSATRWIPLVVLAIGLLGGRWFCGQVCPVGWLQRLLQRSPLPKRSLPAAVDRVLRWCKYLVLLAMPLLMLHQSSRLAVVVALVIGGVLLFSAVSQRPFCKYLCPVGALYGLFNHVSLYQMRIDNTRCLHCHACAHVCPMSLDPTTQLNSAECIRCGVCRQRCPKGAIRW